MLFENLMSGKTKEGLEIFKDLYSSGADPVVIINDLLELVHWLSRLVITPEVSDEVGVSQIDKEKGLELSKKLTMPELSQTWQILLKGYQELQNHDMPQIVAEMILIKLAFAAELPTIDEISNNLLNEKQNEITKDQIKSETKILEKDSNEIDEIKKEKKKSGMSSDTVMEMKNIETLAKKRKHRKFRN